MDDLVAFVTARLDEDEAQIRESENYLDTWCALSGLHLDPARALREVAAIRAILAMHAPVPFWGNRPPPLRDRTPENAVSSYCECQCPDGVILGKYPCDTARLLAAVWGDHPDYRSEWKP